MEQPAQPQATTRRRGPFATVYQVVRHPFEFFEASGELPTRTSPLWFAVFTYSVGFAGAALSAIESRFQTAELLAAVAVGAMVGAAVAVPQVFVASAIAHLSASVLGAHVPFRRTLMAVAYATAPVVLLCIPYVALIAVPYGLALASIGIRQLHSMSWGRAVVAGTMPFVFPVALLFGVQSFWFEPFLIPSGSMAPTIHAGDRIVVNKARYGLFSKRAPARGDVIVFELPEEVQHGTRAQYVKRVVGLPGDKITVEDGRPSINGVPVPFCRVGTMSLPESQSGELFVEFLDGSPHLVFIDGAHKSGNEGPFLVAPNEVFVMGDNRNNAYDSRAWFRRGGGGVPFSKIKGFATMVVFPLDRLGSSVQTVELEANASPELRSAFEACRGNSVETL